MSAPAFPTLLFYSIQSCVRHEVVTFPVMETTKLWLSVCELIWLVYLNGQRLFHTIKPEPYLHITLPLTPNLKWSGHWLAGRSTELKLVGFCDGRNAVTTPFLFIIYNEHTPKLFDCYHFRNIKNYWMT